MLVPYCVLSTWMPMPMQVHYTQYLTSSSSLPATLTPTSSLLSLPPHYLSVINARALLFNFFTVKAGMHLWNSPQKKHSEKLRIVGVCAIRTVMLIFPWNIFKPFCFPQLKLVGIRRVIQERESERKKLRVEKAGPWYCRLSWQWDLTEWYTTTAQPGFTSRIFIRMPSQSTQAHRER